MSLDKLLALAAQGQAAPTAADPAAELVTAALTAAEELLLRLASDDEDGDDDGADDEGDSDTGHADHPTYKALVKKGVPAGKAAKMCAKSDKKVAATALASGIAVALSGLTAAKGDWVALTAHDHLARVALAGDAKEPYGDVEYADPGHQADGKKRYPVDTPEHTRAAWSYINQQKNGSEYTPEQLASVKAKIKKAAKKHGIQIGDEDQKVAATMVELAMRMAETPAVMEHAPFTGKHAHGHLHKVVAGEEHFHNNDSHHHAHTAEGAVADRW